MERRKSTRWLIAILLVTVSCVTPAFADTEPPEEQEADVEVQEKPIEPLHFASIQSGYRFITPDGPGAAASPYGRLKSGMTGEFSAGTLGSDLKLLVDAAFLNEDDYHSELFFDYHGLVRFHAESQALWHNSLREHMPSLPLTYQPREEDRIYGTRTAISQVDTRVKLGNRPLHLNLGYWELSREGYQQQRFSDHYFGTAANDLITDSKRVDQITREGSLGVDAHLGVLDLSYGFRIRDFSNQAADSRYPFTATTGDRHNTVPNNQVTSHTIKLFTDLSGGLVGSASYNLTQRENNGGHGDAIPSQQPSDQIQTVTGDFTYTPSKRHFFALKYRHREIDRTTPATLQYPFSQITPPLAAIYTSTPGELLVRPSSSSTRDSLTFSATFRPGPKVIYRLEYNAELEERNNIRNSQAIPGSPTDIHSDSRQTHTGTATFYWKPVKGGKLNATYSYATCNNPAYASSFSDRHIGKLLATYTNSLRWGLAANYIAQFDSGSQNASTIAPATVSTYRLPRESRSHSANASVWFSPLDRVSITTHYSYMNTDTDQSTLFAALINDPAPLTVTNYHSSAHIYGISTTYAVSEPLDFSVDLQQVRSLARYAVPDRNFALAGVTGAFSTNGIGEISRLTTIETGVSTRADWRITQHLGCSLDYSMRMYKSGNPLYDGSVHATMVSLKARW
jgi:hypothetical protein